MTYYTGQLVKLTTICDGDICKICGCPPDYSLIGEVDGQGFEAENYCNVHAQEAKAKLAPTEQTGTCDWCKGDNLRIKPHRDFEEGSAGRIYDVCQACRNQESESLSEETGWDV